MQTEPQTTQSSTPSSDLAGKPETPNVTFPESCSTVGKKVEYLSKVLMPEGRFADYVTLMRTVLSENVRYIDPVHEFHHREEVLEMFRKYVPRSANSDFEFELLHDGEREVYWRWSIVLQIKRFRMKIDGLVHAKVGDDGRVYYQREYYDPMQSAHVIPVFGKLYKRMLQNG